MRVFPGSFPWDAFDALPLDRYAKSFAMAVEIQEAEAEAAKRS